MTSGAAGTFVFSIVGPGAGRDPFIRRTSDCQTGPGLRRDL